MKYLPYILIIIAVYFSFAFIELDFYFLLKYEPIGRFVYLAQTFSLMAVVFCRKKMNEHL